MLVGMLWLLLSTLHIAVVDVSWFLSLSSVFRVWYSFFLFVLFSFFLFSDLVSDLTSL